MHCLDVITSADAVDGICVAQVVDPQVGQADLPYRALKAVKYRPQGDIAAKFVGEHQSAFLPCRASGQTHLCLYELLLPQQSHHIGRRADRPALVVFGRRKIVTLALFLAAVQLFIDQNRTLIKIHTVPHKAQQLCFCQYKSKKNLLLIRKKHHCFHPVMLLRTILFRLCFFFFVENVIHLPAYLHTTWFINKDFLNNL